MNIEELLKKLGLSDVDILKGVPSIYLEKELVMELDMGWVTIGDLEIMENHIIFQGE